MTSHLHTLCPHVHFNLDQVRKDCERDDTTPTNILHLPISIFSNFWKENKRGGERHKHPSNNLLPAISHLESCLQHHKSLMGVDLMFHLFEFLLADLFQLLVLHGLHCCHFRYIVH
mmetsp:Transcript_32881/g.53363  ORF Transcript_32881/g.53363 Transcript_32881/m.53363 type:complete len:116 (-) Transcript_32881:722-1069(-)